MHNTERKKLKKWERGMAPDYEKRFLATGLWLEKIQELQEGIESIYDFENLCILLAPLPWLLREILDMYGSVENVGKGLFKKPTQVLRRALYPEHAMLLRTVTDRNSEVVELLWEYHFQGRTTVDLHLPFYTDREDIYSFLLGSRVQRFMASQEVAEGFPREVFFPQTDASPEDPDLAQEMYESFTFILSEMLSCLLMVVLNLHQAASDSGESGNSGERSENGDSNEDSSSR